MKYYGSTPVKESAKRYDVIAVGGGFAGVSAAIAAARRGKRVLLIERYNCLGGAACFDLVNPFMKYWTFRTVDGKKEKDKTLSAGIFSEIVARVADLGGFPEGDVQHFDTEILKLVLSRMALDAGVDLLFNTSAVAVEKEGGRIVSLTVSNVSGLTSFYSDVFIDATGDAELVDLAGGEYRVGREEDGLCQPMTLCFRVSGVDPEAYAVEKMKITPLYREWQRAGKILNPREDVLIFRTARPDTLHFNTTRVLKLDPTDAIDVSRAEVAAREQVFEMMNFLRENFSAFRGATLVSTGMRIGARESRMIDGDYVLSAEDLLAFTKFPDGIAACNYDMDIHSPDGSGTSHYYFPEGKYYTIPYRCLTPKGFDNLLAAGRCVSATHEAQASLRIMPVCATLGEAAGVAAVLAIGASGIRAFDVQKLRDELRCGGAVVD